MADRPAAFFIADDLALDFLNTVAAPWGEEIEWLATGADLVDWLAAAEALPADIAARLKAQAASRTLESVAAQARALREWLRGFVSRHAGKPLERTALRELAPVNGLLEQDEIYRQVVAAAPRAAEAGAEGPRAALAWRSLRRWDHPRTLLFPIAEAIGALVCEKDFTLVRRCEGIGCTLWFLDVSKAHARRWCSMAVCGNRAKAAAHRARLRRTGQGAAR